MAESVTHKFGQVIGDLVEASMLYDLKQLCDSQNLYLDFKQPRPMVRTGTQPFLEDINGNKHQLDFVVEKNGSDTQFGSPVGFIESAWRNYTKHSKAKVQEIEGAILPILKKYSHLSPFVGVILAGIFTAPSIRQLESQGFKVLYIPKSTIAPAFNKFGIDIIFSDGTEEKKVAEQLKRYESLSTYERAALIKGIGDLARQSIDEFIGTARKYFTRLVEYVVVAPTYSKNFRFQSVVSAIDFIADHQTTPDLEFREFSISVRYSNGDQADIRARTKQRALEFLSLLA